MDRATPFTKSYPAVMQKRIEEHDFTFIHNKKKAIYKTKDRFMQPIEDFVGFKFGEYKNYSLKK